MCPGRDVLEPPAHVLIVGAGPAGALLGCRLAEAGLRVDIVEGGPEVVRSDAVQRFQQGEEVYPSSVPGPSWRDESNFLAQQGPQPFGILYERVVGGSSWHWTGTCLRMLAEDFEMRRRFARGVDWPITYQDLEPYYLQAEHRLGVAGDWLHDLGSPRSGDYPMPAHLPTLLDQQLMKAAQGLGYQVHPLPAARNSVPHQGRPACCGSASCTPICPIGAKWDATVALQQARSHGARVFSGSVVRNLQLRGERVEAARLLDGRQLRAQHFVVCANAIETPRLLLRSGLCRNSPQLGRNLMAQQGQVSWGLTPEPCYPFRSPQVVCGLTQFRQGPTRRQRAAFLSNIGNDGWPGHSPPELAEKLIDQGLRGELLERTLRQHLERQMLLVSNCEELPDPSNRVELDSQTDALGLERPRIHYRVSSYTRRGLEQALAVHARLFDALGAFRIHHAEDSRDPAHAAGTCRMGLGCADSVVDAGLRCHEHDNLWLVGSSVFPTQGTAPPTLTVAALALRCADHLLAALQGN